MLPRLGEIQDGDRKVEAEYNEMWDDWNDDPDEEFRFMDPDDVLGDIEESLLLLHEALDKEEYEKGSLLALKLSSIKVEVGGDYDGEAMKLGDLLYHDLIDYDKEQFLKEAVYLAYRGTDEGHRAKAMVEVMDNLSDYSLTLESILEMAAEEMDVGALLPSWIEALSEKPPRNTDRLLQEAAGMLGDRVAVLDVASRYAKSHPALYLGLMQRGLPETTQEQMLAIGLKGMEEVPSQGKERSELCLLTAQYALRVGEKETAQQCWAEACRSKPSAVNFLRLRLLSSDWEKYEKSIRDSYTSYYGALPSWEQNSLPLIMFLDGQFEQVREHFMRPKEGIGWSFTFMKEGIALFLLLLSRGARGAGMNDMVKRACGAASFTCKEYLLGTDDSTESTNEGMFLACFDAWKKHFALDDVTCGKWIETIKGWMAIRVQAIMDANRRKCYGECASFLAAIGEVEESRGKSGAKQLLLQEYNSAYYRRIAFRGELVRYGMRK